MRCYFHLENGSDSLLDEVGVDVANAEEARIQALLAISEMEAETSRGRWWEGWSLRAVDTEDDLLFSLPLGTPPRSAHRRTFSLGLRGRANLT